VTSTAGTKRPPPVLDAGHSWRVGLQHRNGSCPDPACANAADRLPGRSPPRAVRSVRSGASSAVSAARARPACPASSSHSSPSMPVRSSTPSSRFHTVTLRTRLRPAIQPSNGRNRRPEAGLALSRHRHPPTERSQEPERDHTTSPGADVRGMAHGARTRLGHRTHSWTDSEPADRCTRTRASCHYKRSSGSERCYAPPAIKRCEPSGPTRAAGPAQESYSAQAAPETGR
jgi:hypothetical protein